MSEGSTSPDASSDGGDNNNMPTTMGQRFFEEERAKRELRQQQGLLPEFASHQQSFATPPPMYKTGRDAADFEDEVAALRAEAKEEDLEEAERAEYHEIKRVLKDATRRGEKPYTIKLLQARMEEIEAAREAREATRRAEEERRELEAREAQEAAWRQQQAEAAEEQQRQEAAREKEREAYEEFKAGITAEAVARAEKEAQHELGFGLEDAWRYVPRAGTYFLFVIVLCIVTIGNFNPAALDLQVCPELPTIGSPLQIADRVLVGRERLTGNSWKWIQGSRWEGFTTSKTSARCGTGSMVAS